MEMPTCGKCTGKMEKHPLLDVPWCPRCKQHLQPVNLPSPITQINFPDPIDLMTFFIADRAVADLNAAMNQLKMVGKLNEANFFGGMAKLISEFRTRFKQEHESKILPVGP